MPRWTTSSVPKLTGQTYIVTGASSGLGLVTAKTLNEKGAQVIAAVRNVKKGREVLSSNIEIRECDLADLESVKKFAKSINGNFDVLINNAGVMAIPMSQTAQGFEMQMGTNHLGHFALTGYLKDQIKDRVVNVSSIMHKFGSINLEDLQSKLKYNKWTAYSQSKLANLLFSLSLNNYFESKSSKIISVTAHPGYSDTNLQANSSRGKKTKAMTIANKIFAQSAEQGALPILFAATESLERNSFVGPDGIFESKGYPKPVGRSKAAQDEVMAQKLWELSEKLTGVKY